MNDLPILIQKSIRRYEPVTVDGLVLWPVLVREYDDFLVARTALEVLHQSLPVRFLRIPLLSAFYKMDYEARLNGQPMTGLFYVALLGLALSLRLGEGEEPSERVGRFRIMVERDDPASLTRLQFTDSDGQEKMILPAAYGELRKIIAAQNGVKLESDRADPDLVQAEKDLAEMNGVSLDATVEDLISGMAALTGVEEEEIENWPILKLQRRQTSYQRVLDYLICGIGQMSGTTWKGGNPHPSPFFDRLDENGFGAHMALGDFAGGAGERAVANAGQQVS